MDLKGGSCCILVVNLGYLGCSPLPATAGKTNITMFFFFFSEMPDLAMRHMPFRSIGMSGRSQICPSRDRSKDAWLQYLGSGGRCGRTSGSGTTCSSDSHVTCVPVSSKAALLKAIDMICSHLIDMIYRTGTSDNTKQKQTGPYLGWSNKEVSQDL